MKRALLLALALAGCVAPAAQDAVDPAAAPVDASWAVKALPHGDDHDHFDVTQHAGLSTPNFQLLGWDPLVTDAKGTSAAGYLCGETATTPDGRQLAVVNSFVTDVVFVVVDVTDRAAPMKVGEFVLENGHSYDVALTADGQHVIIGQDRNRVPVGTPIAFAPKALTATWRSPCAPGGEVKVALPAQAALVPGTMMIGIQDPASPVIEDFVPTPLLGPHSVSTALVDDRQYVISSVVNLVHQASYFQFYEVVGGKLEVLSTWQSPPQPGRAPPLLNGHVDGTIAKHPGTEKTYAYLADWNDGLVILDFTNPRLPMPVGRWSQPVHPADFNDPNGSIHGVLPLPDLWDDGRHYVLAGQELGGKPAGRPTGNVFILDDTDPANPMLVGTWTLPVDVDWKAFLQFSTHYFAVVDKTLFVSTYHGGVWAADLNVSLESPPSIGVFLPANVSPMPSDAQGAALSGSPEVLDVLPLPDGSLLVYEGQSGAYVVRFDRSMAMPAPAPGEK